MHIFIKHDEASDTVIFHRLNKDQVAFLELHNIAELENFKLVVRFTQLPTKEVQAS